LAVAANRLRAGGACVVVDRGDFYPPAAAHAGIPLERMVLVRPSDDREAWWAWEQSLRCSGVAVTLGVVDALDDRAFRRLQLAVETGGGLGFLLRSERWRASPSWASARLWVTALPSRGTLYSPGWRWRVERLPARGRAGATAELEWDGETNPLPLVPSLARSALARRSTSASLSGSGAAHAG
jgi:protein ImuA